MDSPVVWIKANPGLVYPVELCAKPLLPVGRVGFGTHELGNSYSGFAVTNSMVNEKPRCGTPSSVNLNCCNDKKAPELTV